MGKYNDYLKKVQYRNYKAHNTSDGKVIEVVQDVSDIIENGNDRARENARQVLDELKEKMGF